MTVNGDKGLVPIENVRVLKPDGYKLKDSCQAFLELRERTGKFEGSYSIRLVLRSNDGAHEFTGRFMGSCDFNPNTEKPSRDERLEYLRDLVTRRNAKIGFHDMENQIGHTCVSIMYDLELGSRYHAIKGDPRGMDHTKNPKIFDLLPFFDKADPQTTS